MPSSTNLSSRAFFARLLAMTMEGFFGDPIYGGNRNKASWKMLGFPGLPATYANVVESTATNVMSPNRSRSRTSHREAEMVTRLKEVDAVTVGLGWTGAIMARELTKAGLNVVSLEKGQDRIPGEDFVLPAVRDEVRYAQRLELMWDNSIDTLTFRNFPKEQALPIRRIGAFLPGEGVGGSGIHWGALHWRFLP